MRIENIKEVIITEALRLFARQGFEATTVNQIAEAVGIKAPSLYNHFKSKEELINALIERSIKGFEEQMKYARIDYSNPRERKQVILMSEEDQIEDAKRVLFLTLHSEMPSLFARLVSIEQFNYPELASLYNKRYIHMQIKSYSEMIKILVEEGLMISGDIESMAFQYCAPIALLVEECIRDESKEDEALYMIEKHIKQFNKVYRVKKGDEIDEKQI